MHYHLLYYYRSSHPIITQLRLAQTFLVILRLSTSILERRPPLAAVLLILPTPCLSSFATTHDLHATTTPKLWRTLSQSSKSWGARSFCWQMGRGKVDSSGGKQIRINFQPTVIPSGPCIDSLGCAGGRPSRQP